LLDFLDHQHRRIEHTSRLSLLDLNAFRSVQLRLALIELQILLRLTPEYKATRVRGAAAPILQSINTFPTSNGRGTVRIERLRNPFSVLVPIISGSLPVQDVEKGSARPGSQKLARQLVVSEAYPLGSQ
jgi:hypothetical protein